MLAENLSRYRSGLSLSITVGFCIISLVWQSNLLARTANRAVAVLDFFSGTFHAFGSGLSRMVDGYASYETIRKERDLLRDKLQASQTTEYLLTQLAEENRRLRETMSLPPLTSYPVVQAEVISQDPDNWFRTIIINKGAEDGIGPYMPVVAMQVERTEIRNPDGTTSERERLVTGVVGKVIQVNPHSARILPLTDQNSRMGIQVKKSGHWGLLVGQSTARRQPVADYLSVDAFLKPNDEIITSGGDGIFPRGLPVGIVGQDVQRLGGYQRAEVRPIIDLTRLDLVIIIRKKHIPIQEAFPSLSGDTVESPTAPVPDEQSTVTPVPADNGEPGA